MRRGRTARRRRRVGSGAGEHSPAVSSGEKRMFRRADEAGGGGSDPCEQPRARARLLRTWGGEPIGAPPGAGGRGPAAIWAVARAARRSDRREGYPSPGVERETRARVASPRRGAPGARGAARVVPRRRAETRARALCRAKSRGEPESRATAPARRATRRAPRASSHAETRGGSPGARGRRRGARAGGSGVERTFSPRANLAGAQNPGWRDRARDRARRFGRSRARSRLGASRGARRTRSLSDRAREGGGSRRTRVSMSTAACRAERAHGSLRGGEGMRSRLALPRSGCSSEERRGDARATSARGR